MYTEVIIDNLADAVKDQSYGVNRLELVVNLDEGGISLQVELTREICKFVDIPINVMLR